MATLDAPLRADDVHDECEDLTPSGVRPIGTVEHRPPSAEVGADEPIIEFNELTGSEAAVISLLGLASTAEEGSSAKAEGGDLDRLAAWCESIDFASEDLLVDPEQAPEVVLEDWEDEDETSRYDPAQMCEQWSVPMAEDWDDDEDATTEYDSDEITTEYFEAREQGAVMPPPSAFSGPPSEFSLAEIEFCHPRLVDEDESPDIEVGSRLDLAAAIEEVLGPKTADPIPSPPASLSDVSEADFEATVPVASEVGLITVEAGVVSTSPAPRPQGAHRWHQLITWMCVAAFLLSALLFAAGFVQRVG